MQRGPPDTGAARAARRFSRPGCVRRHVEEALSLAPAVLALVMIAACSSQRDAPGQGAGAWTVADERPCAAGCESNIWPRLVLGVEAPAPEDSDPATLVRATMRDEAGAVFEGHLHGCPEMAGVSCGYSFFTTPRDRRVTLTVEPVDRSAPAVQAEIPLGRFNTCGREIAYVIVTVVPGAAPSIGAARLTSPCEPTGTR